MAAGAGSPQGRMSPSRRWAPWTDLFPDIAGMLLRMLPLADRKSWSCVCRSWNQLARLSHPIPRLPVLFLGNLSCSSVTLSATMTPVRTTLGLPVDAQTCVGCDGEWMLVLDADSDSSSNPCYTLVNPFSKLSQSFTQPPAPSDTDSFHSGQMRKFVAIQNTVFFVCFSVCQPSKHTVLLDKAVFSTAPNPGCAYTVAATTRDELMCCHEGVWYSCSSHMFSGPKDLLFSGGRLFLLISNTGSIFALDFHQHGKGLSLTKIEKIMLRISVPLNTRVTRNIVQWRGGLVLVIRSALRTNHWNDVLGISIFQINPAAMPPQHYQLNTLNGDNLFVSYTSSSIFTATRHDEVEGNKVIVVDRDMELAVFSYGIPDAATAILPIEVPAPDVPAARRNLFWVSRERLA